jgi:anti-sigma B factor antagonist
MLFNKKQTNATAKLPLDDAALLGVDLDSISVKVNEDPAQTEPLATLEVLGATAVATVTVSQLTGAIATRLVADLLDELTRTDVQHYVFDLQNVTAMDSTCIGSLVEMLTQIQRSGGRIALVNADHNVACLFRLTRLDRLFPMCKDVMAAIEAVERLS